MLKTVAAMVLVAVGCAGQAQGEAACRDYSETICQRVFDCNPTGLVGRDGLKPLPTMADCVDEMAQYCCDDGGCDETADTAKVDSCSGRIEATACDAFGESDFWADGCSF